MAVVLGKSSFIHNKGNASSDVWVLIDRPASTDLEKGYCFSGGLGFVFNKMMKEAGITDYYVCAFRPDMKNDSGWANVIGALNQYQPKIIIPLDDIGIKLCDELEAKTKGPNAPSSDIEKYAGSILVSQRLNYSHYIIPTFGPSRIVQQYKLRDIVISCDLMKAAGELEYWRTNGILQPLPKRECKIQFDSFDELLSLIDNLQNSKLVSNDIETIYPKGGQKPSCLFKKHPGYPITVGLAGNKDFGFSFDLFREKPNETVELWKRLDKLFRAVPQLGQNFFGFDINFYEMLGFRLREEECLDTMIRHHTLWAELPHKLQFLGRQYTREPFWKDEGHVWGPKQMHNLKRYNCLDVMCTYEIYEEQEKEFNERPHLR